MPVLFLTPINQSCAFEIEAVQVQISAQFKPLDPMISLCISSSDFLEFRDDLHIHSSVFASLCAFHSFSPRHTHASLSGHHLGLPDDGLNPSNSRRLPLALQHGSPKSFLLAYNVHCTQLSGLLRILVFTTIMRFHPGLRRSSPCTVQADSLAQALSESADIQRFRIVPPVRSLDTACRRRPRR